MSQYEVTIPPTETATDPVYSAADLRQRWRAIMGPLGFGERLLWFGFVGPDRRLIKALSQAPIGRTPDPAVTEGLMSAVRDVVTGLKGGTTVALLLTQPGSGTISDSDRQWATSLTEAAARVGVPIEPIFRANAATVLQVDPA